MEKCKECKYPEHDICPMNSGCVCCDDTLYQELVQQGIA